MRHCVRCGELHDDTRNYVCKTCRNPPCPGCLRPMCYIETTKTRVRPGRVCNRCAGESRNARPQRLPAHPTDALPGTPEKCAVLARRYAAREELFHPRDSRGEA